MAFRTPARPLPGAFINTPAPSKFPAPRQPVFTVQPSRNPSGASPINQQQQNPQRETLQPTQRAARTINDVLQKEANFPDLDSYIRQGVSAEYDLPNNTTEVAWQPFQRTEMHEIPDKIYEQYNHAEVSTSMGLFAELNHAWIAIDNSLYLWDYTAPNPDVIGFEEQSNTITCVKLVKPRPGVFVESITYLLVVATTAEIILLGVSTSVEKPDPSARLQGPGMRTVSLYQTKMSLSVKGINVQAIEGSSATGRIFFCGKENIDLYELTYQQEEKWFASRCGKVDHTSPGYKSLVPTVWSPKNVEYCHQIVVDDSRRLVYTLSNESTIRTHHMDTPTTLTQVIEKKRNECLRDISHMFQPTSLLTNATVICSISAISAREGSKLHLMATTSSGVRLFMSATRGYGYVSNGSAPQNMQVQHVRFPPRVGPKPKSEQPTFGNLPAEDMNSPALMTTSSAARFPPGMFFCFVKKDKGNGNSSLFVSSPDTGRISRQRESSGSALQYFEQGCWIKLDSQAEDIGLVTKPFAAAKQPVGFGNELAVQYDEPPQEVAILTNTGVHVIRRRRLVDIFASALLTHGAEEGLGQEIKKFINNYGRAEIISTALAVACGQGRDVSPNDSTNLSRQSDPITIAAAERAFIEFGGKPSLDENQISEGPAQSVENVRPSSRHDGMALYMARLVRSLWKSPVITQVIPPKGGGPMQITSTIAPSKLTSIQENLMKLANFLEKNKSFIEGLAGPDSLQRAGSQQEQIALQGEHQALHSLQKLNMSIIEGISFVQMLFDERVDEIWTALEDGVKEKLRNLTFEVLFSRDQGKDLAKVLVKAIVNRNIANGSNVDTVADALRRRCGSFCSADDVIIFKAQEHLKKASEVGANSDMGRSLLNESLKLFQQVSGSLSYENLASAAEQFTALQFYAGAISLALLVAHQSDRGNRALSWMNDSKPADDPRAVLYDLRKQCYNLIHHILVAVDAAAGAEPDMIDGRPTLIATKRLEAHTVVNDSDDELFQYDLYEWYLEQGWVDMLLSVESEFVVHFLTRSAREKVERADLLWRYHVTRGNYFEAATVQLELAKSDIFPITLAKRIEYLSRAKANASAQSLGYGQQRQQVLLYEITEYLGVANIQDELMTRLRGDNRLLHDKKEEVARDLNGPILELSNLFNDYADQAGYHDICLVIYECAAHHNEADISGTWKQLINTTHEKSLEPDSAQKPFEAIISLIRDMSTRLGTSESTFPPHLLIPLLETYALENQPNEGSRFWLPDLFIEVGWAYEVIVTLLQGMWYSNLAPFVGRNRRVLVEHLVYVLEKWTNDCVAGNKVLFGGEENLLDVVEVVGSFVREGVVGELGVEDRERLEVLRRRLERASR